MSPHGIAQHAACLGAVAARPQWSARRPRPSMSAAHAHAAASMHRAAHAVAARDSRRRAFSACSSMHGCFDLQRARMPARPARTPAADMR
jgi:hypothetical protein